MQRLTEDEKDQFAEYVEKLYSKRYRNLPRFIYMPNGIDIGLNLYPSIVKIIISKKRGYYIVDYMKFYKFDFDEEPLHEIYEFDDIDDVFNFLGYAVKSMKPPEIEF